MQICYAASNLSLCLLAADSDITYLFESNDMKRLTLLYCPR